MSVARKSYSQVAEDLLIATLLQKHKNVTYIDIGCLWPVQHSNTFMFYKNGGRGLCVDANPSIADQYRAERPRDIFCTAGLAKEEGAMTYSMFSNPVFNTFSATRKAALLRRDKPGCHLIEEVQVPVKSLGSILDEVGWWSSFKRLDLFCLDVEGLEVEVLEASPLERLKPTLIVAELFGPVASAIKSPIVAHLHQRGYELVASTSHDGFFKRRF